MQIEHIISHVLDTISNNYIPADALTNIDNEHINEFVSNKLIKTFSTNLRKTSFFQEESRCLAEVKSYLDHSISFIELSQHYAKRLFDLKMEIGIYEITSLLIAQVVYEQRRYLIGIDQGIKNGITYYVDFQSENKNELIEQAILSPNLLKNDFVFCIELSDFELHVIEQKREIQSMSCEILTQKFLQATAKPSYDEAYKAIETISKQMVEKYEMDPIEILPKVKKQIKTSFEAQEVIETDEIAHTIFEKVPLAVADFKSEVEKAGISKKIQTENCKMKKTMKTQKIVTDTKVEITFPVEMMDNPNLFEIRHQSDGMISITLKNITSIQNR